MVVSELAFIKLTFNALLIIIRSFDARLSFQEEKKKLQKERRATGKWAHEAALEKSNRRLIVSPLPLYLGKGERGKTAGLVVLYRSPTTAKKKKKKTVAVQMVIIGELCLSMYKSKGSQQTIKTTTTKFAYCLMSAVFSVLGHRVLFFFFPLS